MRNAAKMSERAFEQLLKVIEPGMTEIQVVGEAYRLMGAEAEAYLLWCIAGENSIQAIARPTHRKIREGELVQIQVGARLGGYASTFGRPLVFGNASDELAEFIQIGLEAHQKVIESMRPGVDAKAVYAVYRHFLKDRDARLKASYLL